MGWMYNRAFEDTDSEAVWMDVEVATAAMGEQNYESGRRRRVRGEPRRSGRMSPACRPSQQSTALDNHSSVSTADQVCSLISMDGLMGGSPRQF